jgi:small ligand-binding sensory domain FIST
MEAEVEEWASQQLDLLAGAPTFGLLFCSEEALPYAEEILEIVRIYGHAAVMVGCSGGGLVVDDREISAEH